MIDKQTFTEIMAPALAYYRETLDAALWTFYWEELRDENPDELRERLKQYMRTRTTFPKVPHLKHVREPTERPRGLKVSDHPDYSDTLGRCMTLVLARIEGHELHPADRDYPLPVEVIAEGCIQFITRKLEEGGPRNQAISAGLGSMALLVDKEFRQLMSGSEA